MHICIKMVLSLREDFGLNSNEKKILERMQRRGLGAQITRKKAAEILDATETTAGRILNRLTQKGYLEKQQAGRKNIYILK